MASFRKADSGKWEVEVVIGRDPATGKKKRKSKRFRLKKDAKQWAREMAMKKEKGQIIISHDYKIKELLEEWLEDYVSGGKSETTFDGYKMICETHLIPALGAIKAKNIRGKHIKSYLKDKSKTGKVKGPGGLSSTTLLQHYHVLSGAFKYARKWDIINHNPLQKIEPPKKSDYEAEYLNKQQVNKLLKTAENINMWTYRFLYLAFKTGMRRGELLGLRWSDIEFNNNKISVRNNIVKTTNNSALEKKPKSDEGIRPVIVSDDVIYQLKEIKKEQNKQKIKLGKNYKNNNLIYCMDDGSKVIPQTAYKRYAKAFKKAYLSQFNLKSLRHTHATFLLQAGVHPKIVQERLGHSSINITLNIYSHVLPSLQEKAVKDFENYLSEENIEKDSGDSPGNSKITHL